MTKRDLRVWGITLFRREAPGPHHQTREIVAAPSRAAAGRAFGVSAGHMAKWAEETGNELELQTAIAEPGVVFWCGVNEYNGPYRRAASRAPETETTL